jgi:hypothetical protein
METPDGELLGDLKAHTDIQRLAAKAASSGDRDRCDAK